MGELLVQKQPKKRKVKKEKRVSGAAILQDQNEEVEEEIEQQMDPEHEVKLAELVTQLQHLDLKHKQFETDIRKKQPLIMSTQTCLANTLQ